MKTSTLIVLASVVLSCAILWFGRCSPLVRPSHLVKTPTADQIARPEKDSGSSLEGTASSKLVFGAYPLWKGGPSKGLNDPRWDVVRRREKLDPTWEGKMAIEFYGKVVDQYDRPVSDAKARFSWTDLSANGSSQQIVSTDSRGLFSLAGVKGKHLVVDITKDGYITSLSGNRFGFMYSAFGDEQYYEPDPTNPVIFRLHKKGVPVPIIYNEKEIKISVNNPARINLYGTTEIVILLTSNQHPGAGKWSATIEVKNGGIMAAQEEFIVEAPDVGYQPYMAIDQSTPRPPTWSLYQGGSFYIKLKDNFGRLDLEMIPGKDWLRIKTWINPSVGSKILETDSNLTIKR